MAPVAWENFPAYLIEHCEGDRITEEGLQHALSRMLADPKYAATVASAPDCTAPAASQPATEPQDHRDAVMWAVVQAGQSAGILRSDVKSISGAQCMCILDYLSRPPQAEHAGANMFWDAGFPTEVHESLTDAMDAAQGNHGLMQDDVAEIQCAIRLPALRLLVTEGDEDGDVFEYKVIEGQEAVQGGEDPDPANCAPPVRETAYNTGFSDGLEVAAVVVNNLRSNGLSCDLKSIVSSIRALKGQHSAHPAGGVVAWLDPNGDPFCNVITAVWKERLVGIESHDGFEREHAAKHTVALTYAALQSSSPKDAKQLPTAWKVFDAGLNKHYLTEHPRVAQTLREEGGNIVKDLFEHPSLVDRETDRNSALEEAAQICDAEAMEWESDAVVTEKNYAQAAARRIRSMVRAVPSEGGARIVAFAGDGGHGELPTFAQTSKNFQ